MRVLITGGGGALAKELVATKPPDVDLVAPSRNELDITSRSILHEFVARFEPEVIINTAAYTNVEAAESDQLAAYAVNADGVSNVAREVADRGGRLVHVSTDYVFGELGPGLRNVDDPTVPLNVYGKSKLCGEERSQRIMPESDLLVVRSGWLYSIHGSNFVKTILRNIVAGRDLQVVNDQLGTPTWSRGLAMALWGLISRRVKGIQHWAYSGVATWYEFAIAIYEEARSMGIACANIDILPINSASYSSAVARPSNSVLNCEESWRALGEVPVNWRVALREMMECYKSLSDWRV